MQTPTDDERSECFAVSRLHNFQELLMVFALLFLIRHTMSSLTRQMDAALGRYYSLKGLSGYYNSDGVGKFREYCEENGLDDDDELKEDLLQDDPAEVMIVVCLSLLARSKKTRKI